MGRESDLQLMAVALAEARLGKKEGGIPIGSCLAAGLEVLGSGRNRRVQQGNPVLHAEIDALWASGRRHAGEYRESTLYTTLSPCSLCAGAVLLYGIPRVVVAENATFRGEEDLLRSRGVEVVNLDLEEPKALMREFVQRNPALWNEDIGR